MTDKPEPTVTLELENQFPDFLTYLCSADWLALVNDHLSIFQLSDFGLEELKQHLTVRKLCFRILHEHKDFKLKWVDLVGRWSSLELTGSSIQAILYKKNVLFVLQKQVSLISDTDFIVPPMVWCSSVLHKASGHDGNPKRFQLGQDH